MLAFDYVTKGDPEKMYTFPIMGHVAKVYIFLGNPLRVIHINMTSNWSPCLIKKINYYHNYVCEMTQLPGVPKNAS